MGVGCLYLEGLETSERSFNSDYYIEAGRMSITNRAGENFGAGDRRKAVLIGDYEMSIIKKADDMPAIYRKNYLAAVSGKATPRNAIKAFCIECMGFVRSEVTNCDVIDCPLNLYRPYRKAGDSDDI